MATGAFFNSPFTISTLQKLPSPPPSAPPFIHLRLLPTAAAKSETVTHSGAIYNDEFQSHQLVSLEYADLDLDDKLCEEVGHVRIRQHVNPLKSSLMFAAEVPDWYKVFKDPTLPLMVDIGTGSGRFLLWLAKRNPYCRNYLGVEIRQKLVKRARYWVDELAFTNVHFVYANAMVSFKDLITTYPGPLAFVSILCPDPHFKKRYRKRRVVQKPLVDAIVDCLMPCGQVFIQSDVLDVALDMRNHFDAEKESLVHIDSIDSSVLCDNEGWLLNSPLGIRTEREIHAENEGFQIFRRIYYKVAKS